MLIGDGWEKDGDYNTGFSQTVLPLPSHAHAGVRKGRRRGDLELELEDDPVYQAHREDWERFHTRFVTPGRVRQRRPLDGSPAGRSTRFPLFPGRAPNGSV